MEKKTILAVVLSMVVMLGFWALNERLFPPPEPTPQPVGQQPQAPGWPQPTIPTQEDGLDATWDIMPTGEPGEIIPQEYVVIFTDALRVVFSNAGGSIVSYQLNRHFDRGEPVEMIFTGDAGAQAFQVAFGNWHDVILGRARPIESNFRVNRVSDLIVEFDQNFQTPGGGQFNLRKRYTFQLDEYMFELRIFLTGGPGVNYFNFEDAAYTLIFGPQIGPRFTRLDDRHEFRRYMTYRGGRLRTERVNERAPSIVSDQPDWAAVVGKYFALVAMPHINHNFDIVFATHPEPGLPAASRLLIERQATFGSRIEDRFLFYLGPKNQQNLVRYERGDNAFLVRDSGITDIAANSGLWAILSPLENALKWLLEFFYRLIPNWGVAIILVTLFVRLVMFPLTKKSSESTLRMQALAPQIKEIQEKYKGNPQKINQEMAAFYKREGYNPLAGCLPMLIQLPIFLAMFQLFSNHFDLRGAMFIPGWIEDLSIPESIIDFPEGFALPLLGWTALRLLPFIYVGSQLLYGKVVTNPAQQGNMQMKIMLYAMPIIFFFILYEMPSGLLIYWIMSNLLTLGQQLIINKYMIRKKAVAAATAPVVEAPRPVIAPPGGGKKKKKR